MKSLRRQLLSVFLLALLGGLAHAGPATGGTLVLTKDLQGATGSSAMASGDFSLRFAWGEPAAATLVSAPPYTLLSGYLAGGFGSGMPLTVLSARVGLPGQKSFYQDGWQVGVALDAPVTLVFSDQLDDASLASGLQVSLLRDHAGLPGSATAPIRVSHDPETRTITISPGQAWMGNTLYDVHLSPQIRSVDGEPLDQDVHISFSTLLDPHLNNVVLNPIVPEGALGTTWPASAVTFLHIPSQSLSDFSVILLARDPINNPLRIDPGLIQEANEKAARSGGAYRVPVSIQEITACNAQGDGLGPLSQTAELIMSYGLGSSPSVLPALIRPQTLSLWALDEEHKLWVKIPESRFRGDSQSVSAPITRFSVFALMGSPDGNASESYAFPVPWRPHGPQAGPGPAQTGTETGGITFSNLPSECHIKIFTLSGELVRELHHTDLGGSLAQEVWDVKTVHGDPVASGVYLWEVSSSVDRKTGKLMVIR